jgi:hypothetical protein
MIDREIPAESFAFPPDCLMSDWQPTPADAAAFCRELEASDEAVPIDPEVTDRVERLWGRALAVKLNRPVPVRPRDGEGRDRGAKEYRIESLPHLNRAEILVCVLAVALVFAAILAAPWVCGGAGR